MSPVTVPVGGPLWGREAGSWSQCPERHVRAGDSVWPLCGWWEHWALPALDSLQGPLPDEAQEAVPPPLREDQAWFYIFLWL